MDNTGNRDSSDKRFLRIYSISLIRISSLGELYINVSHYKIRDIQVPKIRLNSDILQNDDIIFREFIDIREKWW